MAPSSDSQGRNLAYDAAVCREVTLDWETFPDNTDIKRGEYISRQFYDEYGLIISANGKNDSGYTSEGPRVFDTSNIGLSGDEDLGTPSRECVPGSPGVAHDESKAAAARTNCEPLHNILIIEENENNVDPDDNAQGGNIVFKFDKPVYKFLDVGLIDMERAAGGGDHIQLTYGDNDDVERINFDGLGDNTVQTVFTGTVTDVSKVKVTFNTSGGIPYIKFVVCDETSAPVTAAPVTAAPVTAAPVGISSLCPVLAVETEDFESGTTDWVNGKVTENDGKFGTYLGKYTDKDYDAKTFPSKTFKAAPGADRVVIAFDFLEIDSWDGKSHNDSLTIEINGIEVLLAYYNWKVDEDTFTGETDGIEWKSVAQGPPEKLGGTEKWVDQIHRITLTLPEAVFVKTGTIDVALKIRVNSDVGDESGGFDNFEVTSYNCGGGGVNGDPLILGLVGQLFKFDGRSGAWYSAVSAPSFQWNMKIQEYEECPADANEYVSGVGFTVFKKTLTGKRTPAHKIAVNVVNEFGVQTGCGTDSTNCLANGSLELVIDDKKYLYPGDYQFKDGTGRVIAFNTYYECSRKWYDFDITPAEEGAQGSRSLRRLSTFPGVFDVVKGLEDTMVDKDACDDWITERQANNDLFKQGGEWSTVIVKMKDISLHIEYKQEHKRCNAHTVDVWISSVSPELYEEDWEGVIGETKDPNNHAGEKIERDEFLKFPKDEQYEVSSPFSYNCDGCIHN